MQVKQIMIKKVISAKPGDKITEVAQLITKKRIHGVPVVDKKKVVGIITETDFFVKSLSEVYLPSYIDFLKKAKFAHKVPLVKKMEINKLLKAKAEDIMTKNCFTVEGTTDIKDLIKIFKTKNFFTIPVVDKAGKITGIITQADIIKLIKLL